MKIDIPLKWQLLAFALIHTGIFLFLFNSDIYGLRYSATGLYHNYSNRVMDGQLLYRDFSMEYPPLTLLFFLLPRLITSKYETYATAFTIEILLFDLLGLILVAAISRRLGRSSLASLVMYTLALLAIGPTLIADRYDLIPAVLTLFAIYGFVFGKQKTAWALLALGTMTKLYPAIIVPLFLLYNFHHKQYREIINNLATYAVTCGLIIAPFLILTPEGLWASLNYHIQRGLQLESTYSSVLLVGHRLGFVSVELEFSFGAWNVIAPAADLMARLSPFFLLLVLAVIYWRFWGTMAGPARSDAERLALTGLVNHSFLSVLAFLVTGKILSPQFIVWLFPLVPLLTRRLHYGIWTAFIAIALLTYYIFPIHYLELIALAPPMTSALIIRNALLTSVLILFLILRPRPLST